MAWTWCRATRSSARTPRRPAHRARAPPPICSESSRPASSALLPGAIAPELLQAHVAPATGPIPVVAHRILLVVVLVIILGGIERCRHLDRRHDRLLEGLGLLHLRA